MLETGATLAPRLPDAPLVNAEEAKRLWKEYQELESAVLGDDDYLWFVEFVEFADGKKRIRRYSFGSRAEAEADAQKRASARMRKRKVKSACRKLARFFGYDIPEVGLGQVEVREETGFRVAIERGEFYCFTEWLDDALRTVKASATVFIRSPGTGRTWVGRGGAHRSEGFSEDFAIGQTAFTRAVNRATLDAVGYGDESADEVPTVENLPGEQPPEVHPPAERQALWQEVRSYLQERTATKGQVVAWLKREAELVVGQQLLDQDSPPPGISSSVLTRLRDSLSLHKSRLEEAL